MLTPASLISCLTDNAPLDKEEHYSQVSNMRETLLAELKMLFTSRARIPAIEDIPLINASVLNYGVDESFSKTNEPSVRYLVMEQRIKKVIIRFEPRLSQVSVNSHTDNPGFIQFTLHAYYFHVPVVLNLIWDDYTGKFYFDE